MSFQISEQLKTAWKINLQIPGTWVQQQHFFLQRVALLYSRNISVEASTDSTWKKILFPGLVQQQRTWKSNLLYFNSKAEKHSVVNNGMWNHCHWQSVESWIFQELHCKTALQYSPEQLKHMGTCLNVQKKKKKNIKWIHTAYPV